MTRLAYLSTLLFLLSTALPTTGLHAQEDPEESDVYEQEYDESDTVDEEDPWALDEEFRMGPPFGQGTSGAHISLGFAFSGIAPADLDPELGGDLILSVLEIYVMRKGLLFGGSWTSSTLYDAPLYDEFVFDYKGVLLGYDYSLFYGKMGIRPAVMVGRGDITMIRTRPDITYDTLLNPSGNVVLERVREDEFWMIRPSLSLTWSPSPIFHFRAEGGYLYGAGGESDMEDLRKPFAAFHFLIGTNR